MMNRNATPADSLERLRESLIALVRSKLNVTLGSASLMASVTVGRIVWGGLLLVLFFNVFLFANIALGFYLGSSLDSAAKGFGLLALGYLVLSLVVVLLRGLLQRSVQNKVARVASDSIDRLNTGLDDKPMMRVVPEYREVVLRSHSQPMEGLERRVLEANRRAAQAQAETLKHIDYLRLNYKRVVAHLAEERFTGKVPAYSFVARLINRALDKEDARRAKDRQRPKRSVLMPPQNGFVPKTLDKLAVSLPYIGMAFRVLQPVLGALVLSKSRNILAKFFGLKKKF